MPVMKFPSQHIQLWPLERLIPYDRNPRKHSDAQVKQIANSMQRFGFLNPLLVDEKAGLIAGHGRLLAARLLRLKEVPVIVSDHLTESEKRAYGIVDNKLALRADWDEEKLRAELAALKQDLFELELTGFDEQELEQLMADLDQEIGTTDEDAVPEPTGVVVSVLDDLWTLDNHRVLCGDATSSNAIERLMAGEQAAMTFTDPSYNVNYEQRTMTGGRRKIANDDLGAGFEQFLYEVVECTPLGYALLFGGESQRRTVSLLRERGAVE